MIHLPRRSYDSLRTQADQFLGKHHPSGSLPVPIEQIIESDFALAIIPIPYLQRDFHIDGFLAGNMTEITVDEQSYMNVPRRARFTLAHELAHLLLHKPIFEGKMRSIEEYKKFVNSIDEETYAWIEWQARCLAGLILVPNKPLKIRFEKALAMARKNGLDPDTEPAVGYICDWISDTFEVSSQVVSYRLNKDEFLRTSAPPDDYA
jgi:hypothetical protein